MNLIKYGLTGNMLPFCPNIVGYKNGKIPRKVKPPAINPMKANQVTFLKYQIKSIFSMPMAATPAAEPMTSMLPPVPAE